MDELRRNIDRQYFLGVGVPAVDSQIGAGHVCGGVRQEEGYRSHQILGLPHLALWDKRSPLGLEVWLVVEDLLRSADRVSLRPLLTRRKAKRQRTRQ